MPRIPETRRIKADNRVSIVPFNPNRAAELFTLESFEHVFDSLAFWARQMRRIACPDCGIVGSLVIDQMPHGIVVHLCSTVSDFEREAQFYGQAEP